MANVNQSLNKSNIPNSKINAPTINNTSKKSVSIENNNYKNINNNIKLQTAKEEAGIYEVVTENYLLLLGITSALIIIIIIYFFSASFRIGRALDKMIVYQGYQRITSINYNKMGNNRLGDCFVSSAYNAAHSGYQMYDYTSEKMVLALLQNGVRYLEFNVFNSEFGEKAFPVVSMGYKTGEWKMMINDTPLETIFKTIADNAFKVYDGVEGVYNSEDPVFIGLNLNTNSNLSCLNLIAYLITQYFGNRLLDNEYSYQNSDAIADISLIKLMGKVVFFASDGFQGSGMEELVNYSWDNINNNKNHSMQRIHYTDLMSDSFDTKGLIKYNKKGLTIVVPHKEGDFFNENFNSNKAFELGCQFIAMEFQNIDSHMDSYITRFKKNSILLKDEYLRKGSKNDSKTITTTIPQTTNTNTTRPQTTNTNTTRPQIIK